MDGRIGDIAALEASLGKTPDAMHLKVVDHLDEGARRWIGVSPLAFAAFGAPGGVDISLAGGAPGFAECVDERRLRLPAAVVDRPGIASAGFGFGGLFVVPGLGETLRVNGRVAAADADGIEIAVEEVYVHCAKAMIRSDFWSAAPLADPPAPGAAFFAACRFVALASMDGEGRCDVSPKGDPAGDMLRERDGALLFADRPGNRRADSFRNILSDRRVALAALAPGSAHIAVARGALELSSAPDLRASFAVRGKTPLLTARLAAPRLEWSRSAALARAVLWPAQAPREKIDAAAVLVAHVKKSRERGLQASIARVAVSVPGLMRKGLERDYESNLY